MVNTLPHRITIENEGAYLVEIDFEKKLIRIYDNTVWAVLPRNLNREVTDLIKLMDSKELKKYEEKSRG